MQLSFDEELGLDKSAFTKVLATVLVSMNSKDKETRPRFYIPFLRTESGSLKIVVFINPYTWIYSWSQQNIKVHSNDPVASVNTYFNVSTYWDIYTQQAIFMLQNA